MNVLILEHHTSQIANLASTLRDAGHSVTLSDDLGDCITFTYTGQVDLLIASLMLDGDATLSAVMSAQYHNPDLATILLSDALLFSQGELFEMLTSLRCVLGKPVADEDVLNISSHYLDEIAATSGHAKASDAPAPSVAGPGAVVMPAALPDPMTRPARTADRAPDPTDAQDAAALRRRHLAI